MDPQQERQMTEFEELKKDFSYFKSEIKEYVGGLKEWQATTTEYRKSLCEKIDKIKEQIFNLPCKERVSLYKNFGIQIKFLWALMIIILTAIISEWIKIK